MKKQGLVGLCFLLVTALLVGCGKESTVDNTASDGTVNLTWYITGIPQKDLKTVNEKVNEYVKAEYGFTVTLNQIDFGEYDQKMSALVNAGESFDLAYTASWLGGFNYLTNARKGAFLDISEYLEKEQTALKAEIFENFWKGATIDTGIYAVPTQKEIAATEYFVFNKELVEKYNIPYTEITNYDELEPWLRTIKEKENIVPWFMSEGFKNPYRFDELSTSVGINLEGDPETIVNYYFEDEYINRVKTIRKFMEAGLINKDAALSKQPDIVGKDWLVTSVVMGPLDTATVTDQFKKEVVIAPMVGSVATNASTLGGATAISSNCKHPAEAMQLLEAVNTDPVLINLLAYGIEGTHYEKIGETQISWLPAHSNYAMPFYMFGNYFNLFHQEGAPLDEWDILRQYNKDAEVSPALGFNFDTDKVTTEIAALNNVQEEFKSMIGTGSVEPTEALATMKKKMETAGLAKIVAEMQAQFDEWRK